MSVASAKPQVWAARLLANLNNEHIFAARFNKDYEGEIRSVGDTVRINGIGRVSEGAYTQYSDITIEQLDTADQTLTVTEDRYFAFSIDDADELQSKPELMDAAMGEAAYALAERADDYAAELLRDNVATANKLAAAVGNAIGTAAGNDDAFNFLVQLGVLLDTNNVPRNGRWAVAPPWFCAQLVLDPRRTGFGTGDNLATYRNGEVGKNVAGFTLYMSNNCPAGVTDTSATAVIAGHSMAATWAEQIPASSFELFRPEKRFEDAAKGRYLYGAKVTRPYALAWGEAKTAS